MSKVLKVAAVVAGIALAIPTGGTSLLAVGLGVSSLAATAIVVGLTLASSLLAPKPKAPKTSPADRDRLFASIDPRTPRKIVYGRTAMATDIRDQEYTGADDEYFHRFMVAASHKVNSIEEIWFDDKLAWTVGGGVQGEYVGYLTVAPILEGTAGNAINISARMGATRRYTGLAYVHFRYKLTGSSSKATSPFSQSIPTRVTIIGDGMAIYDPRKDSTRGGSGSHRIDDQTTWTWDDDACRNPALQLLNYLIGYKINGKLAVGKGIPPARIDIDSFATAANACDEPITLAAGGTEPRYRTDGIFSEADPMELVVDQYKSSMNAITDDAGGQIRVIVLVNDLGSPIADFDANDVLGAIDWKPGADLSDRFNIVKGSHTDPSTTSLYQSVDYPEQFLASTDDIDRTFTVDFPLVQSVTQCQRLAKQRLQRAQFGGIFSFIGQSTFWKVLKNDVIRFTFPPLGMTDKLFRVVDITAQQDGMVPIVLREEDASIYAWDTDETAALVLAAPDSYDYLKNPLYEALAATDFDIATLTADLAAALALATARGKVWTTATVPATADSNVGDTWIAPDGVFYDRVPGGILLGGFIVTLGGFRPSIYWTRSTNQPLEATIAVANDASAVADAAADRIEAYDDDDILDISEKRRFAVDDQQLEDSYQEIIVSAAAAGVSYTALTAARTAYLNFRNAISRAWNDTTQDSPVTRSSLDAVVNPYAAAIEALRAAIEVAVKGLVDTAQSAADAAQAAADAAQAAADAAQADADTASAAAAQANTVLANIANDDLLTPDEKPEVILKRDVIIAEQAGIEAEADSYGITTEKTAYTASITALTDYLATLTTPVLWSSFAGNTTIVGTTFRTTFADVYAARQALLNKIAAVAKGSIDTLTSDLDAAIALAEARGKVWTTATVPATAESNVGDTWIAPDGVFYDRVPGGILLGGFVVTLGGFRPSIYWTRSVNQPLEATIASADAANARIAEISSDNLLTPVEKMQVLLEYNELTGEKTGLLVEATTYGVTTAKTNYENSINALIAYMATLTSPVLWSDLSGDTTIVGTTFRANFLDVRTKKRLMINEFRGAPDGTKVGPDFAEDVAQGAANATAGLNTDGTVKDAKVAVAAIQANAVSAITISSASGSSVAFTGIHELAYATVGSIPASSTGIKVQSYGQLKYLGAPAPGYPVLRLYRILAASAAAYLASGSGSARNPSSYGTVIGRNIALANWSNIDMGASMLFSTTSPAAGDLYVVAADVAAHPPAAGTWTYNYAGEVSIDILKR